MVQQESCIESLRLLKRIRTLKLALELREDPYNPSTDRMARRLEVGSVGLSIQRWADALAVKLPTLQKVAFEIRPHTGRGIGPRVLIGSTRWIWFQRRPGGTSMRRTEPPKTTVSAEEWALAEQFRGLSKGIIRDGDDILPDI
jgi:hypothetical protein